jgi:hypothetical protein
MKISSLPINGFSIADLALLAPGPGQFLEVGGESEGRIDIDALAAYCLPAYTEIHLTPINSFTVPVGESNRLFVYPDGNAEVFFTLNHPSIPAPGTVALSWDFVYQAIGRTYPVTASTGLGDIFRIALNQQSSSLLFTKILGPSTSIGTCRGAIRFRWK